MIPRFISDARSIFITIVLRLVQSFQLVFPFYQDFRFNHNFLMTYFALALSSLWYVSFKWIWFIPLSMFWRSRPVWHSARLCWVGNWKFFQFLARFWVGSSHRCLGGDSTVVERPPRGTPYNPPSLQGAPLTRESSAHASTVAHCGIFLVFHESFVLLVEVQVLFSLGIVSKVISTTSERIPCTNVWNVCRKS